ncbi:transcriptional antiterminator, BglG family [Seinonella peptonophila]|uniref:Transcriptional antiterminator, BglG family n=1 Tax=Seinonella peptonophila TaxID=112248 RepID=A0A1M4V4R1_9BACL|nr:PRD domain-containing protein [Seinonella peptonophila]SHE63882.1 transcriptional antiterminator, BglG family [Seinonella peptonophila]
MRREKKEAFLNFLETQNNWTPASNLANHLHVSTRTIRKYVSEINKESPLILSSQEGYRLNKKKWKEKDSIIHFPDDTPSKRMNLILRELILHPEGINIFDLSEKTYVSLSTIESDVTHANHLIQPFQLRVKQKKDHLILVGEETAKRKLMSQIISNETSNDFLGIETIQEAYQEYHIAQLKNDLSEILRNYDLLINEYMLNNILLHLVITIDRIKKNKWITQQLKMKSVKSNSEILAARSIAKMIEDQYGIIFNESEIYYLVILLASKTTLLNYQSITPYTLTQFIDKHYVDLAKTLLKRVHESYFIDISDDDFFVKFTLHIRNLIFRAKNQVSVRNPLVFKLKETYPLIYEVAVFISNELQQMEAISVDEDEIGYIAFHIGSYFERRKELEKKILCAVICPNYYDMQIDLVQKLEEKFRDSIEIIHVSAEAVDLAEEIELVISTLPSHMEQTPSVFVHPYMTEQDYERIQRQILKLTERKKIEKVKVYLETFFCEELFMKNVYLNSHEEYIAFMSECMMTYGYVHDDYAQAVLERETLSSTAFNNHVAVPHSIKMDARKTGICIILNDQPVKWGDEKVQIIAMIAMNQRDRKIFSHVFESFINILSEWDHVKELIKAKDYQDFMDKIVYLVERV